MTQRRIADALGWSREKANATLVNARRVHPGQIFRVAGYVHDAKGQRSKDQSLYAAEPGEDVQRPLVKKGVRRRAAQARYRDKHRARLNAELRARRAKEKGLVAETNPWSQLTPAANRSAVTQIELAQRARKAKAEELAGKDKTWQHTQSLRGQTKRKHCSTCRWRLENTEG